MFWNRLTPLALALTLAMVLSANPGPAAAGTFEVPGPFLLFDLDAFAVEQTQIVSAPLSTLSALTFNASWAVAEQDDTPQLLTNAITNCNMILIELQDSTATDGWTTIGNFAFTGVQLDPTAFTFAIPAELQGADRAVRFSLMSLCDDDDDNNVLVTLNGASSVPLPGAAWLLGSGVVGLVGLRRLFV